MSKWLVLPGVDYGRDLDAVIPGAQNFQYGELVESAKAVKLGIANVPTEAEWKNLEIYAVFILQPLRNKCGRIKVSSAFRCKALNDAMGSSDTSFHRKGAAGDLEPQDCTLMELLEVAHTLHFSEIIAEYFPDGWLHVAFLKGDDRAMLKLKDYAHNYQHVTLSHLRKLYPKG